MIHLPTRILKHSIFYHSSTCTNLKILHLLLSIQLYRSQSSPFSNILCCTYLKVLHIFSSSTCIDLKVPYALSSINRHRFQSDSFSIIHIFVQISKHSILYHLSIYIDFKVLHPLLSIYLHRFQSTISFAINSLYRS